MANQPMLTERIPHPANFMYGRQGRTVRNVTFHHVVGTAESAVSRFQTPVQVSSHFIVGPNVIYVMVDTDDTAYTNGNWEANLQSVTIEHAGTWLNGFRDEKVINNSVQLVAWLRTLYPAATPNRHRDVFATACPGELPVEEIWAKAGNIINPPAQPQPPVVPAPKLTVVDIKNKIIVTNKDANLWDLSFTKFSDAKSLKVIPKNTEVEVSATAKHPLGSTYYLTEYSFSKGVMNGINVVDCKDKVTEVPPTIPPVTPKPEQPKPSRDDVQDQRLGVIEAFIEAIKKFFGGK